MSRRLERLAGPRVVLSAARRIDDEATNAAGATGMARAPSLLHEC